MTRRIQNTEWSKPGKKHPLPIDLSSENKKAKRSAYEKERRLGRPFNKKWKDGHHWLSYENVMKWNAQYKYEYENFILIRHIHNTNINSNELFTEYNQTHNIKTHMTCKHKWQAELSFVIVCKLIQSTQYFNK